MKAVKEKHRLAMLGQKSHKQHAFSVLFISAHHAPESRYVRASTIPLSPAMSVPAAPCICCAQSSPITPFAHIP